MFPLHGLGLRFGSLSQMVTEPILGMDLHPKNRSPSQLHYISIRDQSESETMEKSCVVQVSESNSESGNGNKPFHAKLICKFTVHRLQLTTSKKMQRRPLILILLSMILVQRNLLFLNRLIQVGPNVLCLPSNNLLHRTRTESIETDL